LAFFEPLTQIEQVASKNEAISNDFSETEDATAPSPPKVFLVEKLASDSDRDSTSETDDEEEFIPAAVMALLDIQM